VLLDEPVDGLEVHLALEFETWRSLERRQGLTPERAVELAAAMVRAAAAR
jgi:hypothetical protein